MFLFTNKQYSKMFSTIVKINFYDADPVGIMFFGNIFRLAHTAYEELIEHSTLKKEYFYSEKHVVPVIHSEADFLKPLFPNTKARVNVEASLVKESSFELRYSFLNENDELCARVKTVHVFLDKTHWKKSPIPPEFKDFLKNL